MATTASLNPYEPCSKCGHWDNSEEIDTMKCSSDTIVMCLKTYNSSNCVTDSSCPIHDAEKVITNSISLTALDCPPIKSSYNTYITKNW